MFAKAPRDARPMELHTPESIFYIKIWIFNTKMNDRLVIKNWNLVCFFEDYLPIIDKRIAAVP